MKVPEVSVDQYKAWAKRNDMALNVSDEELEVAMLRANIIAQDLKDAREANKKLCQGSSVVEHLHRTEVGNQECALTDLGKGNENVRARAGSNPAPGDIKKEKP